MIDKGVLPKSLEKPLYTTFLASTFRSIRFGINEAHGRGIAIQLNYLLDQGGFTVRRDGTFAVNLAKVKEGVAGLTRDIMTIQAEGDYKKALELRDRLGVVRPARAKGARQAEQRPGRHRAALHDGGSPRRGGRWGRVDPPVEDEARIALPMTDRVVDPVCGMTVDPARAAGQVDHEGRRTTSAAKAASRNSRPTRSDTSPARVTRCRRHQS